MVTKPTIYTEKRVKRELRGMLKRVREDKEICFYKELTFDKEYTSGAFNLWKKKYKQSAEIQTLIKKLFDMLEFRVVHGAFSKKYHPIFSIFFMKNHFAYSDTNKLDLSSKGKRVGYVVLPMLKSEKKLSDAKAKRIGRDSK